MLAVVVVVVVVGNWWELNGRLWYEGLLFCGASFRYTFLRAMYLQLDVCDTCVSMYVHIGYCILRLYYICIISIRRKGREE